MRGVQLTKWHVSPCRTRKPRLFSSIQWRQIAAAYTPESFPPLVTSSTVHFIPSPVSWHPYHAILCNKSEELHNNKQYNFFLFPLLYMLNPNYISIIIIITQNSYEEQIHTKKTRSSLNSVDIPFVSFSLRRITGRERRRYWDWRCIFFF